AAGQVDDHVRRIDLAGPVPDRLSIPLDDAPGRRVVPPAEHHDLVPLCAEGASEDRAHLARAARNHDLQAITPGLILVNMFTKNNEPAIGPNRPRGRPRGLTPRGSAARLRLYSAALELMAERGYAGTTLRDVAGRAGASVGLLYRYFPSKRSVLLQLYDELSTEFAAS